MTKFYVTFLYLVCGVIALTFTPHTTLCMSPLSRSPAAARCVW